MTDTAKKRPHPLHNKELMDLVTDDIVALLAKYKELGHIGSDAVYLLADATNYGLIAMIMQEGIVGGKDQATITKGIELVVSLMVSQNATVIAKHPELVQLQAEQEDVVHH
jgi:hypothetical protein